MSYSPSDLVTYITSPYESLVKKYMRDTNSNYAQEDPEDPFLSIISSKGDKHETSILRDLINEGKDITIIEKSDRATMLAETHEAILDGKEVIYQGSIENNNFYGRADFLIKQLTPSGLGDFSYEIWDAKLSKSVKPEHIIQLCCYADILSGITESIPQYGFIISGDKSKLAVSIDDYFSFYSLVRDNFLIAQENKLTNPPNPGMFKNWGIFSEHAKSILEKDDHLSQIAGIRYSQVQKLNNININTIDDLLLDDAKKPKGMEARTFARIRQQARLQKQSLSKNKILYELIESEDKNIGLWLLPKQSKNDIYFDLESNPLNKDFVLHYLWGVAHEDEEGGFKCWWAHDREEMQDAFSKFIDWAYTRWTQDNSMHIYHYGHFETSTIKSLMGEFGLMETKIDNLLRNGVFVDLYKIIKQSLCIGTESYGLKTLEPMFRDSRSNEVQSGQDSTVQYEEWIHDQLGNDHLNDPILKEIWDYNKEDCESLIILAAWLRNIQHQADITPVLNSSNTIEINSSEDIEEILMTLLSQLKDARKKPHAKLLANLSLYHKRENKPEYWKMFERLGSTDEELIDDLDSLGALTFTGEVYDITTKSKGFVFSYDPNQETKLKKGDRPKVKHIPDLSVEIYKIDGTNGYCTLKSTQAELDSFLSLVPFNIVNPKVIEDSIREIAQNYIQDGSIKPCLNDLLNKARPNLKISGKKNLALWGSSILEAALTIATNLKESYLVIQGPPGTGKTYVGSKLIAELVNLGYRVGVASNSHKAIDNLLESVIEDLDNQSISGKICRINTNDDPFYQNDRIHQVKSASDALFSNDYKVFGGTSWCFANTNFNNALDYLFIDEAGQVSLANMVGISASTDNIILMGDQMQLSQPTKGTHPKGAGLSALDYLLGDNPTIPEDVGLLLPQSYRLHPKICDFVSNKLYEGRISAIDTNKNRLIVPCANSKYLKASGIHYVELDHNGNEQASYEEAEVIKVIIKELLKSKKSGYESEIITENDVLVISPYNHQTRLLQDTLSDNIQIGTVDKFQGRQAPVVIISMASSDIDSSPRGAEFLFNKNRLNVAITRAKSLAIIVGSKNLISTSAPNLRTMNLTNFYIDLIRN